MTPFTHIKQRYYMLAILFGILMSVSVVAQAVTKENAVKAGFIYNFTKFTVWPDNASSEKKFNLCIIGDNNLNGGLEALYGKLVADKPLVLRRHIKDKDLSACHMAFITKDDKRSVKEILQTFTGLPVLTVSDSPEFIDRGGMIGLIRDGNRVGFEINVAAVNAAGLHIGAQLLKLAKEVKGLE